MYLRPASLAIFLLALGWCQAKPFPPKYESRRIILQASYESALANHTAASNSRVEQALPWPAKTIAAPGHQASAIQNLRGNTSESMAMITSPGMFARAVLETAGMHVP